MSDDIKKAAEHIIALCNRLNVSDSDESRWVASAYLALREQVETVALPILKETSVRLYDGSQLPGDPVERAEIIAYADRLDAAIKAIEEGRA